MGHFVYQINEDACALACFQMILMNETGDKTYRFSRLNSHPPHSLEDLENGAKRYGYLLSFYRAEGKEISYPWNKKQGFLATIQRNDTNHMVYVKKITKNNVIYYDPAEGKKKKKRKEFELIWSGIFGALNENGQKILPKKVKLLSVFEQFVLFLFPFVSDLALLIGFYFFYDDGNFLLPVICFSIFGIFAILSHLFSLNVNSHCDKTFLKRLPYENREMLMRTYKEYHCYKRYRVIRFPRTFISLLACLSYVALISINNPFFLLPVSVVLSSYLIFMRFASSHIENDKEKLVIFEKALQSSREKKEMLETINRIGIFSRSFGLKIEYGRIVISVLALASNLFSLLGSKEISLNYYLFHLFSLIAVFFLFKETVDLSFSKKEYSVAKGVFIEYFLDEEEK